MALEKALSDGRQKAVMLMIELSESARCIQTPPPVPIRGNIASMRAASAAEKDRTLCRLRYRNAAAQLAEISEGITSGTSLLNGNIRSIRRGVSIKLTAFIQGVRSRKNAQLSTYRENEPVSFYGTAFEDYVKSRKPGDDAIRKAVDSCCSDGRKE